jgi:hypothetical protein
MLSYRSISSGTIKLRMMTITGIYSPIGGNHLGTTKLLRRIHQETYNANRNVYLIFIGDFNSP